MAQVERAASVGSRAGIAVGNPDVVRLPASSRSTGRRQVGSHGRFLEAGLRAHAGGRVIDALFSSRITFSFYEATAVHCASDAVTMVAYVGCCVGSGTGGGGVLLCANNKPSTPRYSPLGKPAHPTDRPTDGHHKAAIFWGGAFFSFFCLRPAPVYQPNFHILTHVNTDHAY